MSELQGCLQDFGLVPLVRFVSEQGRSGSLRISNASWVGELVFDQGRVIAAAVGQERGQVALELIARAPADAHFVYTGGPAPYPEAPRARAVGWSAGLVRDVACTAVLTIASVLMLRSLIQTVQIEGESMQPGLQDGQHVLVNRLAYVFSTPRRGDVVVFQSPDSQTTNLMKRVVALPGEEVRIEQGNVFVDGRLLDERYAAAVADGIDRYPPDGQAIRVPDGSYLVLGDNRSSSLDSLPGWLVRRDSVIGRAWLTYWPPTAWGLVDQPLVAEVPQAAAQDTAPGPPVPLVAPVLEPTPLLIEPTARPATPTVRTLLTGATKDQPGWPSHPNGTAWLDASAYRLAPRQLNRFVAVAAPVETTYTDVVVTAAFHKLGGPPGGGYGIIVRDEGPAPRDGVDQSGRFYVAEVGDRGEIGVWRREHDHWVELLPWTPSAAVHPGGISNELAVRAVGQRLTLYVNGIQTSTLLDAALSSGRVGAFVGGDYNEVVLDRFTIQLPS
jgi:signal peptidase I